MNEIRKYVASRTLSESDLTWTNSMLLSADDAVLPEQEQVQFVE